LASNGKIPIHSNHFDHSLFIPNAVVWTTFDHSVLEPINNIKNLNINLLCFVPHLLGI